MIDSNKGLTKTYNRFHDPKERSPEIVRLRELHSAMDRAVLASYRWTTVDTTCGFDLDWCEAEAADDASPETIERLEAGRYFFESAAEAQAFAAELVGIGKGLSLALPLAARGPRRRPRPPPPPQQATGRGRTNRRPRPLAAEDPIDDDETLTSTTAKPTMITTTMIE